MGRRTAGITDKSNRWGALDQIGGRTAGSYGKAAGRWCEAGPRPSGPGDAHTSPSVCGARLTADRRQPTGSAWSRRGASNRAPGPEPAPSSVGGFMGTSAACTWRSVRFGVPPVKPAFPRSFPLHEAAPGRAGGPSPAAPGALGTARPTFPALSAASRWAAVVARPSGFHATGRAGWAGNRGCRRPPGSRRPPRPGSRS